MARTVEEFETIINNAIAARPELLNMNSVSETAYYKMLRTVISEVANIIDVSVDNHKAEVLEIVSTNKVLRLDWYRRKALEFQLGDSLIIEGEVIKYATEDIAKRIITRASTVSVLGKIKIKVAKGEPGSLAVLENSELAAVQGYFDIIQGAGDQVEVVSISADILIIRGVYFYDPLITLSVARLKFLNSINAFLAGLSFDGELKILEIIDAIQSAEGCVDLDLIFEAKAAADLNYTKISRGYKTSSGHLELSPGFVSNITDYITFKPLANVPN